MYVLFYNVRFWGLIGFLCWWERGAGGTETDGSWAEQAGKMKWTAPISNTFVLEKPFDRLWGTYVLGMQSM